MLRTTAGKRPRRPRRRRLNPPKRRKASPRPRRHRKNNGSYPAVHLLRRYFFPPEALDEEAVHGLLGEIIFQGRPERLHGDLHPCRTPVTTRTTDIPERFHGNRTAVLTVAVPPKDDDQPVLYDAGDDHMEDVDDPKVEIGHLHTDVRAFDSAQKADHPVAVTAFVVVGIIVVFQEPVRNLVQLDATDELSVGPRKSEVIGADVLEAGVPLEIERVASDPIEEGRVEPLGNLRPRGQ